MRKHMMIFLILSLIIVLAACGRPSNDANGEGKSGEGNAEFTLRLAHLVPEEASGHKAAIAFKEKVEKESENRIEVQLFPNAQLYGSDREAIEAVQTGNLEMTLTALAPVASFNSDFLVFDLPFLFDTKQEAYNALDSEAGTSLLDELKEDSLKGLTYGVNGFRHITNSKHPIETPEDMKGLKLRTLENPLHTDTFKALGANASPFAFGEMYTALQQGTYDAMESPIVLIYLNKFYEVQDYVTLTGHVFQPGIMLMNNELFEDMPEDLQKVMEEASDEYRASSRELAEAEEKEFMELLIEDDVEITELTDEQLDLFKKETEVIYDEYGPQIGEELIEDIKKAKKE